MNLLERENCLSALAGWQAAIAERGGCIVLIGGEAGIGKTSLLHAFANTSPTSRIVWGACDALYTPQPLAPLYDIARQTGGALAKAVNAGVARDAAFPAALDELSRPRTVFMVEDLHWADEATLDLLKYLGRRIHRTPGMMIVTYRDDEVGPQHPLRFVMGDLPRGHTHRLALVPLTEAAVGELARRAGRPSRAIYQVTGGNPLFVTEVLASDTDGVPVTVRDAVLARTLRLSPVAREIAEFVAVIPGKADAWLLAGADRATAAGVDECLAIGMRRHEDGSLSYRHELVRRALEDSLSSARGRELHTAVLDVMRARPDTPVARMAHHAKGAGNAAEVLRLAPVAAEQAATVGAHREAASHWQSAIRHSDSLASDARARLHEKLSYECYLIDEIERAIRERAAALEIWRAVGAHRQEGHAAMAVAAQLVCGPARRGQSIRGKRHRDVGNAARRRRVGHGLQQSGAARYVGLRLAVGNSVGRTRDFDRDDLGRQ